MARLPIIDRKTKSDVYGGIQSVTLRKIGTPKKLKQIPVSINDTSEFSENYFNVVDIPRVLTAGKNVLKIQGSSNLQPGTEVQFEVLDFNGSPIYAEVVDYTDEDNSLYISIWIYPDTPPGAAEIILVGTTILSQRNNVFNVTLPDVRWITKVNVSPGRNNESNIIFTEPPSLILKEEQRLGFTKQYTSNSRFITKVISGSLKYNVVNNTPYITSNTAVFNADMIDSQITFATGTFVNGTPNPAYNVQTSSYSAKIVNILNESTIRLSDPYSAPHTNFFGSHFYREGTFTTGSIVYEQLPSIVPVTASYSTSGSSFIGQSSASYGVLTINNISPAVGAVDSVKVYLRKSTSGGVPKPFSGYNSPGTYELVSDTVVSSNELLIDTGSLNLEQPVGLFSSKTQIENYFWIGHSSEVTSDLPVAFSSSIVPVTFKQTPILRCISLDGTNGTYNVISNNSEFVLISSLTSIVVSSSFEYQLTFNTFCSRSLEYNGGAEFNQIDVVAYGSAISPGKVYEGKTGYMLIGNISSKNNSRFDNTVINFTPDTNGTVRIAFYVRSGRWFLSDISVKRTQVNGFTPDSLDIIFPIREYVKDKFDVKVEYYDKSGNQANLYSELKEFSFTKTIPLQAESIELNTVYVKGNKLFNYGQFYDTTTQSGSRNVPYAMKFNSTDISNGVSITNNSSGLPTRLTVANKGIYNVQFSAQLYNTANSNLLFTIWFRVTGSNVPHSSTNVEIVKSSGVQGQVVASWNYLVEFTQPNQYAEIMWSYDDGSDSGQLLHLPSSSLVPFPEVPSVIATVTQIA